MRASEIIQAALSEAEQVIKSSSKPNKHIPRKCPWCAGWEGTLVRVFPSEDEFQQSEFYGGEDRVINDPHGAKFAVWPGKTNANRSYGDWWICTPVHPNCSHAWEPWEPPLDSLLDEESEAWFKEWEENLMKKAVSPHLKPYLDELEEYVQVLKSKHFGKEDAEPGTIRLWADGYHIKTEDDWERVSESNDGKTVGPFGPIYHRFWHRPEEAIEHLLKVKNGEAVGAIYKEGIGDIDFVWDDPAGKGRAGLRHILERREKDHNDAMQFIKKITEMISKSVVYHDRKGRNTLALLTPENEMLIVVQLDFSGNKKVWVLTAYVPIDETAKKTRAAGRWVNVSDSRGSPKAFPDPSSQSNDSTMNAKNQLQKSAIYRIGIWEERTCACHGKEEGSWTKNYLRRMVP